MASSPVQKLFCLLVFVAGPFLLLSCSNSNSVPLTPGPTPVPSTWVVGWGNSPENALTSAANPGGQEQSFRSFLLPTVSGTQERVHLSNLFGTAPITVGAAQLATAPGGSAAVDPVNNAPLTFSGSKTVTIAAGQEIVSDPVNLTYTFGQKMAVTIYLQGAFPSLTQHESQVTTNYATLVGAGDKTADFAGTSFSQANTEWFVITGVDVYGPYQGTVAIFGSSSVDGHASDYGNTNSYPTPNVAVPGQDNDRPSDWLARELNTAGYKVGVLNAGTIGDPAGNDARTALGAGAIAGVDRIDHDVLQQPGIKAVVIYFGGIDLRADCKSAATVEGYLTTMISKSAAAGVRVVLATLPPSEYCSGNPDAANGLVPTAANPYAGDLSPGPENSGSVQRRMLNDWIRNTASSLPGVVAIADFDKALLDPNHPDFMIPNLNSGDNFHPNGAGYGVQSTAIPLGSLLAQ